MSVVGIIVMLVALILGIVAAVLILRDHPLNQGRSADIAAGAFIAVIVFGMILLTASDIALLSGK